MRDVRLEMYVFRRIFLQDTHFNVEIAKYNSNDKYFIRRYREMLHTTLLAAVAQHGMHRYVIVDTSGINVKSGGWRILWSSYF